METTETQADEIRKRLTAWYAGNRRRLPWRETRDPYRIWVSEVMLQQTQVNTVVPYYERFIERFPDVIRLSRAPLESVLKLWEGLGYYGRARNLHHAARTVADEYAGAVPDTLDRFLRLKGVGDYIGSAVMSIAFGRPHAVVDGNVKRVLARIYRIDAPVNHTASHKRFKALAQTLLDRDHPGEFNQAVMELGALVCRPRTPLCAICPVRPFCGACAAEAAHRYPVRMPTAKPPRYHIAVGVVRKNGRMLITRRKPEGLLGGLWEFPGGKVHAGETARAACIREIAEETGLTVRVDAHLKRVAHAYTHFRISMDVFVCRYLRGRIRLRGPVDHRWIRPGETGRYPFPRANHKFLPELMAYLEKEENR